MRLIDVDALINKIANPYERAEVVRWINKMPTVDGWISIKKHPPEERPSIFDRLYGTDKWSKAMWRTESEKVIVAVRFQDGTRSVTTGNLRDGEWRTTVSPVIPHTVTHWMPFPGLPKEDD